MKSMENRIYQTVGHIIMATLSFLAIFPFLVLTVSSFTSEATIMQSGYNFIPIAPSMEAYVYLWKQNDQILRAYGVTVLVSVLGTLVSLSVSAMLAYPLSRKDMPGRNGFTFFVFFTMLFNGGLVPTYLMYTNYLGIKNTIWALIIPGLLVNAWYVLLMRTYFITSIPVDVISSAQIDGAGELRTFLAIILPMSKPILATVGLFAAIAYWNDWYNGMIYLTNPKLFSIQNLLTRMMADIQFLSNNSSLAGNVAEVAGKIPSTTVRMAIAVVGALPVVLAYPFFQGNFVKGIALGAVKG